MTTAVNDRLVDYTGDGSTVTFAFDFPISAASELELVEITSAGVSSTLVYTTDYTVTIGSGGTGTITRTTAPASGSKLYISGNTPSEQSAAYSNVDDFPATAHEGSMDSIVRVQQELKRNFARVPRYPFGETSAAAWPTAALRAGYIARFNPTTGALEPSDVVDSIVADLIALEDADLEHIAWLVDQLQAGGFDTLIELGVTDAAAHLTYAEARALSLAQAAQVGQVTIIDRGEPIPCVWVSGDQSAGVTGDEITTGEGDGILWFAPTANKTGASGAFKALVGNVVTPLMYGATGDGAGDDADTVVTAANSGKNVRLPKGYTFLMDGRTIVPVSRQSFFGGGRLKKTTTANDLTPAGVQDAPKFFHISGVDDVTIDGIEMEYTGTVSPRVYGATLEDADNCRIVNNKFVGTVTPCFIWKGCDRTTYVWNRSEGGNFGVATGGDGAGNTDGDVTNTLIEGNIIRGAISEAIDINWDTVGCTIRGNHCIGNNTTANEDTIDIGGGTCRDIIVEGNILDDEGNAENGINVKLDTKNVLIRGNRIKGGDNTTAGTRGIFVATASGSVADEASEVLIDGNEISGFNQGIYAYQGTRNIKITNNDIRDLGSVAGGFGIRVDTVSPIASAVPENILISGNTVDGEDVCAGQGIRINHVKNFIVSNNDVRGFASLGIYAEASATLGDVHGNTVTTCSVGISCLAPNVKVRGNTCFENDSHGINLQADYLIAQGNLCLNNGNASNSNAIVLTSGSDNCVLTDNIAYDNQGTKTQRGLNITGACANTIVRNNHFTGNLDYDYTGLSNLTSGFHEPKAGYEAAVSSDGSGDITVTHGLGVTPTVAFAEVFNNSNIDCRVYAKTSTTFTLRLYNSSSGAAMPSTAVNLMWQAAY